MKPLAQPGHSASGLVSSKSQGCCWVSRQTPALSCASPAVSAFENSGALVTTMLQAPSSNRTARARSRRMAVALSLCVPDPVGVAARLRGPRFAGFGGVAQRCERAGGADGVARLHFEPRQRLERGGRNVVAVLVLRRRRSTLDRPQGESGDTALVVELGRPHG